MASRTLEAPKNTVLQSPTIPGYRQDGGSTQSSEGGSFTGIEDPKALQMLMQTLTQLQSGGTPEMKRQRAERQTEIGRTRAISGDYSKGAAFQDAADLMAQNLRQSMERNMPVINKSIQGAGTSASSMQGLLSQKLATESAQAAGALGAEQARAYGNISANLQGVLEALTRVDNTGIEALLKGLELSKVSRQFNTSSAITMPSYSQTASGGGSYVAGQSGGAQPSAPSPYQDGVWYGPPTSGDSQYVPVGTPRSYYPDGKMPYAAPYGGSGATNGYGTQQGMTADDLYEQANQSNAWATGSSYSGGWGYGD